MIKIGVLADTHLEKITPEFEQILRNYCKNCDWIFHAGDFVNIEIYEYLKEFMKNNVKAVCGNMDYGKIREILPKREILEFEGVKIGLIHGWGPPSGIEERLYEAFLGEEVHCIVHGHTHHWNNEKRWGILFFNPGSPTDRIYARENTVGILTIHQGSVSGEIIKVRIRNIM
jgi:putative phosphoesterase